MAWLRRSGSHLVLPVRTLGLTDARGFEPFPKWLSDGLGLVTASLTNVLAKKTAPKKKTTPKKKAALKKKTALKKPTAIKKGKEKARDLILKLEIETDSDLLPSSPLKPFLRL
ncbi:hypothetical protein B0T20DRAFT_389132 [Sordaria brevicollis]|uniref:Uncharacterized protein n=1 Tax=Sordaria brevicollis TaxID=83679 RepID=A0AAE0PP59_SORBR|nr:hypothetical protein B0T20DRAFT_389132 [Sordaria brevicollis]